MKLQLTGKPIDFITQWNTFRNSLPPCPKTSKNPHYKSAFTPLDTWVNNSLRACNAAGVALIESMRYDGELTIHCIDVITEHGSFSSEYLTSPTEAPQQQGSALTYARRYHLQTVLGAVGEDDDDAEVAQVATTKVAMGTRTRRGTL